MKSEALALVPVIDDPPRGGQECNAHYHHAVCRDFPHSFVGRMTKVCPTQSPANRETVTAAAAGQAEPPPVALTSGHDTTYVGGILVMSDTASSVSSDTKRMYLADVIITEK